MPNNNVYQEEHARLAEKFSTEPQIIAYIRSFTFPDGNLRIFIDHLEEVIAKKNFDLQQIQHTISRITTKGKVLNETLTTDKKNLLTKRDFFLAVYTFIRKLSEEKYNIIRFN